MELQGLGRGNLDVVRFVFVIMSRAVCLDYVMSCLEAIGDVFAM